MGCVLGDCDAQTVRLPSLSKDLNALLICNQAIPQLIEWYREGKFPLESFVRYFDVSEFNIFDALYVNRDK